MIAVVGGGILGRLTALTLLRRGHRVTLFDDGAGASRVAAGMLSPHCERDSAPPEIAAMGAESLAKWPAILATLIAPVYFQRAGSFVVGDPAELTRLARLGGGEARASRDVEPEIDARYGRGIFFADEGQIDARGALDALAATFRAEGGVVEGHFDGNAERIVDCRGLAARDRLPLRGVRGEIIEVIAPDVRLTRPVRLAHPRYPLYIVPRPDRYLIGATQIESDDAGPVTVRSALELLSAAFALHSGFGEAKIVDMRVGVRPAFADNLPRVTYVDGTIYANGMFRHGFLLAPVMAERIAREVA